MIISKIIFKKLIYKFFSLKIKKIKIKCWYDLFALRNVFLCWQIQSEQQLDQKCVEME